jgi:hypothetical protein
MQTSAQTLSPTNAPGKPSPDPTRKNVKILKITDLENLDNLKRKKLISPEGIQIIAKSPIVIELEEDQLNEGLRKICNAELTLFEDFDLDNITWRIKKKVKKDLPIAPPPLEFTNFVQFIRYIYSQKHIGIEENIKQAFFEISDEIADQQHPEDYATFRIRYAQALRKADKIEEDLRKANNKVVGSCIGLGVINGLLFSASCLEIGGYIPFLWPLVFIAIPLFPIMAIFFGLMAYMDFYKQKIRMEKRIRRLREGNLEPEELEPPSPPHKKTLSDRFKAFMLRHMPRIAAAIFGTSAGISGLGSGANPPQILNTPGGTAGSIVGAVIMASVGATLGRNVDKKIAWATKQNLVLKNEKHEVRDSSEIVFDKPLNQLTPEQLLDLDRKWRKSAEITFGKPFDQLTPEQKTQLQKQDYASAQKEAEPLIKVTGAEKVSCGITTAATMAATVLGMFAFFAFTATLTMGVSLLIALAIAIVVGTITFVATYKNCKNNAQQFAAKVDRIDSGLRESATTEKSKSIRPEIMLGILFGALALITALVITVAWWAVVVGFIVGIAVFFATRAINKKAAHREILGKQLRTQKNILINAEKAKKNTETKPQPSKEAAPKAAGKNSILAAQTKPTPETSPTLPKAEITNTQFTGFNYCKIAAEIPHEKLPTLRDNTEAGIKAFNAQRELEGLPKIEYSLLPSERAFELKCPPKDCEELAEFINKRFKEKKLYDMAPTIKTINMKDKAMPDKIKDELIKLRQPPKAWAPTIKESTPSTNSLPSDEPKPAEPNPPSKN